jgi:hypothetical protein
MPQRKSKHQELLRLSGVFTQQDEIRWWPQQGILEDQTSHLPERDPQAWISLETLHRFWISAPPAL